MPDGAGSGTPQGSGTGAPRGVPDKTTRERAHEALVAAGLDTPPSRSSGPRRLVIFAAVVLVVLALIVVGSLIALDHLQGKVTTTTTTTTTPATPTTVAPTTTTVPLIPGHPSSSPPLDAYVTASADGVVLRAVGTGGQPLPIVRTNTADFVTDPSHDPYLVYWWTGACGPCAAENLVVVSALSALGGTFGGLATTTEPAEGTGTVTTIDLRHATYHGPVVLDASEVDGATGQPDQIPPPLAKSQFVAFDARPFTKDADSYPFLDVGGHFVQVGAGFTSQLLVGLTLRDLATDLTTPDSAVTRAIDGSANELDAAVCVALAELSRPRPTACSNPAIATIEPTLPRVAPRATSAAR